jgi:APA family basic amino acid/polyamine antiporter
MPDKATRIRPELGSFDTAMIVVSLVIGIGIFRTPALVASQTGRVWPFVAAWIVGGLISLAGALTFAEIGARYPRPGGYYKVAAACWHPALAFMLNWAQVIMQGVGATGVAFIGAEYLLRLLAPDPTRTAAAVPWTAAGILGLLLAINFAGVRSGSRTQNLLSLAKIGMILMLVAGALWRAGRTTPPAAPSTSPVEAAGFLTALVAVLYTYGGYQTTMNVAADVREARRNLPRAVTIGMLLVTALYLLINFAYVRVLGIEGVANEKLVAAGLARACFGAAGEAIVSAAIALSAAGFVNATILQVPRSYLAMAEDGVLPRSFLSVHPQRQVQKTGLAFFAATTLLPVPFLGSFEKLVGYVMFTDSLMIAVVASALFVLRRRHVGEGAAVFRVPGYPLLPLLYVACMAGIAVNLLITRTSLALIGCAVLAAGWPLYLVMRRLSGAAPEPAALEEVRAP